MRLRRAASLFAAATLSFALARPARAQIVNVQPLVGGSDAEGPSGALEASGDWRSGSTRLLLLSASLMGRYRSGRHLAFALVRGDYGVQAGSEFLDRDLEHARYRVVVAAPFEWEIFAQHERDRFRRVELRVLAGAGPRFHVTTGPVDFAIGTAVMPEYERLRQDTQPDAGGERKSVRWSSYASYAIRGNEHVKLAYTFYLQPRFDELADLRALSDLDLLVDLAVPKASLKLTLGLSYESRPPAGVVPLDATRKAAIQFRF